MSGKDPEGWSKPFQVVALVAFTAFALILGTALVSLLFSKDQGASPVQTGETNRVSEVTDRVVRSETRTNANEQPAQELVERGKEKAVTMVTVADKRQREVELKKKIAEAMTKVNQR